MDLNSFKESLATKSKEELLEMLEEVRAKRRAAQTPVGVSTKKAAKEKTPKVHELNTDDAALLLAMLEGEEEGK